ncbi:MAG: hypothetical protein U9Q77_10490 [Candidatus Marinimicrobia bacterium]|nr:hypothetical protein [Candidatus Neomarinimicrobiota bacterium]
MKAIKIVLLIALTALVMVSCKTAEVTEVVFLKHNLEFSLNVENHRATFVDSGLMNVSAGVNVLYLPPNAKIDDISINGASLEFETLDSTGLSDLKPEFAAKFEALDLPEDALWVLFDQKEPLKASFYISYSAVFEADVAEAKFSNQNVGREITGTIIEKGAYFSPSSFYYPRGNDGLMRFEVTATIPANWESIADGNSIASVNMGTTKRQSWQNPYESDGLMFMAAPFVVKQMQAGEIDVFCYFFEEDTSLFETYLPATANYVKRYSDLIGSYPYKRFTVAENFFPTGYGMPAWTLLGQQVIRLPFIVMSSLGHEVLHNWWGNSIYVDYEKGNWCEGLTVYGADYRYKLDRSPASARDYRKDILKAYKNYVTPENEFPVREFVARHNAESRTIGYNKAMMIFHMIEERIGTEDFIQAWRDVYAGHKGEKVTWEQWITAYEKASGEDLSFVIPQWVDQVGAARISVELLESEVKAGQTRVKFKVTQTDDIYNISFPIKFSGIEGQSGTVGLSGKEAVFEFTVAGEATAFELDPDYNIFRHLYPEEIEPTVAAALGASEKHFVYYADDEQSVLKTFGDNLTEGDVTPEFGTISMGPEGGYAIIALNPTDLPVGLSQQIEVSETSITIKGTEYPRTGHTFVLSAEENEIFAKLLIVISEDLGSLPRLGQLVPHYGKYSYLVFKGPRNIAKGQWPALTSPLRVEL